MLIQKLQTTNGSAYRVLRSLRSRCLWHGVAKAVSCLAILLAGQCPDVSGQGLLGKRYVGVGFTMEHPNDDLLQDISDWMYGANVITNFPLTETWDVNLDFGLGWFGGTTEIASVPVSFDTDIISFEAKIIKHFFPEGAIDPFAGIGVGYAKGTFEMSVGPTTVFNNEDITFVDFVAGFEWKATDRLAIRPQITSIDFLDDFDVDEVIKDYLFFETQFIWWCNENWFTGFTIGSDFDDTEIGLGFFLGYGAW